MTNLKYFEKFWKILKNLTNLKYFEKFEKFWKIWEILKNLRNFEKFEKFWEEMRKKIVKWEMKKKIEYRISKIENRLFPRKISQEYSIFFVIFRIRSINFVLKMAYTMDFQRVKWHIPWDDITPLWYMHENLKNFELLTAKFAIKVALFSSKTSYSMANLAVKSSNFFKISCLYHNWVMPSQGICHFTRWKSKETTLFRSK